MLLLLLDMVVMWFILNAVSNEYWDDQKLKVLLMTLSIAVIGGVATTPAVPYLGPFALGIYFVVGMAILMILASLTIRQSAIAMGVFTVYRLIVDVALLFVFA